MLQTKQDMSRELLSHLSKNLLKNKLPVAGHYLILFVRVHFIADM